MQKEKISIILPCHNVENTIDRCINSILLQSYGLENLELVCVDDASTDSTLQKLQEWELKLPENLMLIPLEKNQMLGEARNIGLSYATGAYIAFIDTDDWIDPLYFEVLYQAISEYQVPMVRCEHIRDFTKPEDTVLSEKSALQSFPCQYRNLNTEQLKKDSIRIMSQDLMAWGKLIKKEFLIENNIYFPAGLAYEDNFWGPLLYLYAESYCVIKAPLYHYYVNESSLSMKMNAPHHPDFLTVQLLKINELDKRGFLANYPDEIEYDFLHSCYLDFMKLICMRYDPPSYSLYQLMCQIVLEHAPNHKDNPYFEQGFTQFQKILLGLLSVKVDKDSFMQFAEHIKQLGV